MKVNDRRLGVFGLGLEEPTVQPVSISCSKPNILRFLRSGPGVAGFVTLRMKSNHAFKFAQAKKEEAAEHEQGNEEREKNFARANAPMPPVGGLAYFCRFFFHVAPLRSAD